MWRDVSGSPAVEFAMIAPLFLITLAATFDVGSIIHSKFRLDAQITAASSYGQTMGIAIQDNNAAAFAGSVATLVAGSTNIKTTTVVLNNAMGASFVNGVVTTNDTSGIMAQCYCPSRVSGAIEWGAAKTCYAVCTDGSLAGRFIEISASTPHVALFGDYGMTQDSTISVLAIVRMQ